MEKKSNPQLVFIKDGPIMIEGEIEIIHSDGTILESKRSFLCRCGASNKKPYCDGTHKKINFKE